MGIIERKKSFLLNEPHLAIASGNVATFDTDLRSKLKKCKITFLPIQSGSGDPSPTNIRPISGRTGISINNNGDTISVSWQTEAGTVYGGYVDLTSGELVITHKMVDMGDLAWTRHQSTHYFMCLWTRDSFANTYEGFALDTFCSCYKSVNQSRFISGSGANLNYVFGTTYISSAKTNIAVRDNDYSDATAFRTSVTGQKLVYPIVNPIIYQLTPQTVKTLISRNNIWSDAGDVEIQYWKH